MCPLQSWFSDEHSGARLMVGLNNLRGLFQTQCSVIIRILRKGNFSTVVLACSLNSPQSSIHDDLYPIRISAVSGKREQARISLCNLHINSCFGGVFVLIFSFGKKKKNWNFAVYTPCKYHRGKTSFLCVLASKHLDYCPREGLNHCLKRSLTKLD